MLLKYTRIFKENTPDFIQNQLELIELYFTDSDFKNKQRKLLENFLIVKHTHPTVYKLTTNHHIDDENYYFEYKIAETIINTIKTYKKENQFICELKTILEETLKEIESICEFEETEDEIEFEEFNFDFDWENTTEEEQDLHIKKLDIYLDQDSQYSFWSLKESLYKIESFDERFFKSLRGEYQLVLNQEQRLDFCKGLQLFIIFQDRYVWYSENSPNRSKHEIIPIIQAFERWKFIFEPIFIVNKYFTYDFANKGCPLVFEYISIAQMCWYFYNFTESLNILEHSLEQAIIYLKEKNKGETPFFQLTKQLTSEIDWKIWNNPEDFYYFNYFYIAEIYEKLENYDKAIENYKVFIKYIPNFKNNLDKCYSRDFYHSCKKVPDTLYVSNTLKKLLAK